MAGLLVVTCVVLLLWLLVAERRGWRAGMWVFKPLASTAFVLLALALGATGSVYGSLVLVGLCLSWVGDVLLIPRDRRAFRGGLVSFLLGHVAYVVAFGTLGLSAATALPAAAVVTVAGGLVYRWLHPNLGSMAMPVLAYVVVISAMVAAAAGTAGAPGSLSLRLGGAVAFYLSDLFVARDRFVAAGFPNRLAGLPLYYGGQLALALSIGS